MSVIAAAGEKSRIEVIDAGRGTAMLFVFLSHFSEYFMGYHEKTRLLELIYNITMLASPSFMLISGSMLGYLYHSNRNAYARIREKYIDRGMFLLIVAHIFIFLFLVPFLRLQGHNYWILFITDAIGFSMILGSILIPYLQRRSRLLLSALLYLASWGAVFLASGSGGWIILLKEAMFGSLHHHWFDVFPFVPWFALFMAGTVLGEKIGINRTETIEKKTEWMFLRTGAFMLGIFVLMTILKHYILYKGHPTNNGILGALLFHGQKNPPGLAYFLFYGGTGILLLYVLNILLRRGFIPGILNYLKLIGRNSLFVFVIQYFVFFFINVVLRLSWTTFWPLIFLAEVIVIVYLTGKWDALQLNRFFTVLHPGVWKSVRKALIPHHDARKGTK